VAGSLRLSTVFFVSLAIAAAVVIAAVIVDARDAGGCGARQAWLYATVLTVSSLGSGGVAKSGSRDRYTEDG
jgi:hypothetical protein